MTHREVLEVVETARDNHGLPQASCVLDVSEAQTETNDLARIGIGPDAFLLLQYERREGPNKNLISLEDHLVTVKAGNFQDIRSVVGDDLFPAVESIHRSPSPHGWTTFNPIVLLGVVNQLQSMGKEKALRALRVYAELRQDPTLWHYGIEDGRVFLITRLLFVRTDGKLLRPRPGLGVTQPDVSTSADEWPIFPLVTTGGIPFLMNNGYLLAGVPESPVRDLDFCEKHCRIIAEQCRPTMTPLDAARRIYSSDEWKRLFEGQDDNSKSWFPEEIAKHSLRCQAIRSYPEFTLTERLQFQLHPYYDGDANAECTWSNCVKKLESMPVHWGIGDRRIL